MGKLVTIEESRIEKHSEHQESTEDAIFDPRSWSPSSLKEACNNLKILYSSDIQNAEAAAAHFLLKDFFYIMHQTGLYNLQRKLWNLLAQGKKIKIKRRSFKKWGSKRLNEVSDLEITDNSESRSLMIRLVHKSNEENSQDIPFLLNKMISNIPKKCLGAFFISPYEYKNDFLNKIKERTQANDSINRYKSPLNNHCSLNLFHYDFQDDSYVFKLVHPDLDREIKTIVGFNS